MKEMYTKSLCSSKPFPLHIFLSLLLLLSVCSTYQTVLATPHHSTPSQREVLEIIIGGGGDYDSPSPETAPDCPPPPQPPCPPPPPPPTCPPPPIPPTLPPPPIPPTLPPPLPPPSPRPQFPSRVLIARKAILEFRKRITFDPMNITHTWNSYNACDFTGFRCGFIHEFNESVVYGVQFNGYNFNGPDLGIDNFIEKLPDVSYFHANSNNFRGTIPDLSKLPRLYELDLSSNYYTGEFPENILSATKLVFLDIRFNFLTGRVPPQIFNMTLLVLFLNDNNFEQDIPSNFGSTPAVFLTLDNNKFTGSIPKSIKDDNNTLVEVLFLNNRLTGCLPYEIGLLKQCRVFDVSRNQLTGPIPQSFACLAGMKYLVLANNQFYGTVPELVCKLPLLINLNLCDNYFTQVGPECMKLIRSNKLEVTNNCILGLPNQRSAEECAWFFNKPKFCPDSNMYNYIPCKGKAAYLESNAATERVTQALSPTSN